MLKSTSNKPTQSRLVGVSLFGVLGLVVIVGGLILYSMNREKTATTLDEV